MMRGAAPAPYRAAPSAAPQPLPHPCSRRLALQPCASLPQQWDSCFDFDPCPAAAASSPLAQLQRQASQSLAVAVVAPAPQPWHVEPVDAAAACVGLAAVAWQLAEATQSEPGGGWVVACVNRGGGTLRV